MIDFETDNVPEGMENLYTKDETSGKFRLNVKGVVPETEVQELRKKNKEFRDSNITLKQQLEKLSDFEAVMGAKEGTGADGVKETIEKLLQSRTQEMKSKYESDLTETKKALAERDALLEELLLTNAVKTAAMSHGVATTAVDDVVFRAKGKFKVVDGKLKPTTAEGDSEGNPLTVDSFVAGLKNSAPHLFPQNQGTGMFQRSRNSTTTQPNRSNGALLADLATEAKAKTAGRRK